MCGCCSLPAFLNDFGEIWILESNSAGRIIIVIVDLQTLTWEILLFASASDAISVLTMPFTYVAKLWNYSCDVHSGFELHFGFLVKSGLRCRFLKWVWTNRWDFYCRAQPVEMSSWTTGCKLSKTVPVILYSSAVPIHFSGIGTEEQPSGAGPCTVKPILFWY